VKKPKMTKIILGKDYNNKVGPFGNTNYIKNELKGKQQKVWHTQQALQKCAVCLHPLLPPHRFPSKSF
jgi:hypothetical protein